MVELIDDLPKCSWQERVSGGSYSRQLLYSGRRSVNTLDKLYCGIAKPGKVATSPELPHPSRAAQLEPSGTKQEPSQHAVSNTCIATWSQVEPSQRAVKNTCAATWNQVEPSGTKRGTKQNFNPSHAKPTALVTAPSPFYNTK